MKHLTIIYLDRFLLTRLPGLIFLLLLAAALFLSVSCKQEDGSTRAGGYFDRGAVVFIGTSITDGKGFGGTVEADTFPAKIGSAFSFNTITNAGKSGDTSTGMLARFDLEACAKLAGLIVIEVGTNDPGAGISTSTFTANLTAMVRAGKRAGANVAIMVPPYSTDATRDANIDPYRTAARTVATNESARLFDTYTELSTLSAGDKITYYYQPDGTGLHFTAAGNTYIKNLAIDPSHSAAFAR